MGFRSFGWLAREMSHGSKMDTTMPEPSNLEASIGEPERQMLVYYVFYILCTLEYW